MENRHMKYHLRTALLFLSAFSGVNGYAQQRNEAAAWADSLVHTMSVEEKIGQMTLIDLGVVAQGEPCALQLPQHINGDKLQFALQRYHVGAILNTGCGSGAMRLENWRRIIRTIQEENQSINRHGIPVLYGIDAIHGANYTLGSTLFPQQLAQAATWNPQLVEEINRVSAYETRAAGIPWNFSPVLDLGRQPLWSRFFETYGEDVHLATLMGEAAIRGLQGDSLSSPYSVAACLKHFAGYSMPLSGKDRTPAWIPERELREYFLPPFAAAFNAGAATTMINSGDISGTPVHADSFMLQQILRREMGFKGLAVTDWEDIYKLSDIHRVAPNRKEAVRMAIEAGIDMSMTPNDFQFNDLLLELVKEGRISESRLDVSVKRILLLKRELGLFAQSMFPDSLYKDFGSEAHRELSYRAAVSSITLLKNEDNILPLENEKQRWAICGPGAHSMHLLNGAWSRSWQGNDTSYRHEGKKTIAQAMQVNMGERLKVLPAYPGMAVLKKTIQKMDGIVVCLAEAPGTEIPGNIDALELPANQKQLVADALACGKPVVLVCTFNRPLIITEEVEKAAAVLYTYLPGDEGGRATADILCGNAYPGGRLPFTYPRSSGDIVHYDRKHTENMYRDFSSNGYRPLFDFAHGLSYSNCNVFGFKVSDSVLNDSNIISLQFTAIYYAKRNNKTQVTVPIFYSRAYGSITPPVKKLIRFVTFEREGFTQQTFALAFRKSDFSFINRRMQRVSEPGPITLQIGDFTKQIIIR